jgi:streptogramin lyase
MKTSLVSIVNAIAVLLVGFASAAARADVLYGSNPNTSAIDKINSAGVGQTYMDFSSTPAYGGPQGIAFDLQGNLYVAEAVNNQIIKITPARVISVFANVGLNSPFDLAFDVLGNLYVANYGNATIEKFNTAGVGAVFATNLSAPRGLALDRAGNLFVADGLYIRKFTPGGVSSIFADTGGMAPAGLAFDASGNLYAAYSASGEIMKFTPDGAGTVFSTLSNTENAGPTALAFDSAGNLFVSTNGPVVKIAPAGVDSEFNNGYAVQAEGLAFTTNAGVPLRLPGQIPEPACAGLLSLGAALLGARRRRHVPVP